MAINPLKAFARRVKSGSTKDVESVKFTPMQIKTELLSGLTVALALVPEAVAFAFVAGVHPLVGLYANIPSYRVKEGDVITLRSKAKDMALVLEAVQSPERDTPDYIDVDHSKMTATFIRTPSLGDIPYAVMMEPNLVVEYYAKN